MTVSIKIRTASRADASALFAMQALSLRRLASGFYEPEVLEAFITQGPMDLVMLDGDRYFVAEANGHILGSGGWSPNVPGYHASFDQLDTDTGMPSAVVRSLFIHPDAARRGVASASMMRVEAEIRAAGFNTASLHATLSGIPFYRRRGWRGGLPVAVDLPGGHSLVGLSMTKQLMGELKAAA